MRKPAKSIRQLQAQLAAARMKTHAQSLEDGRVSATKKKRKKAIADPNTQFSGIGAIKRAQEDPRIASASVVVNRTRRVITAARKAEISTEHGLTYSLEECRFEFEI
ncbi:hypothetical protein K3495_g7481 [Podosphaera aphanis]|nr:hypothetical protein K3495_g7481 [Podosphaera aphanis]